MAGGSGGGGGGGGKEGTGNGDEDEDRDGDGAGITLSEYKESDTVAGLPPPPPRTTMKKTLTKRTVLATTTRRLLVPATRICWRKVKGKAGKVEWRCVKYIRLQVNRTSLLLQSPSDLKVEEMFITM